MFTHGLQRTLLFTRIVMPDCIAWGQIPKGSLNGLVTDPGDAAVVGAQSIPLGRSVHSISG